MFDQVLSQLEILEDKQKLLEAISQHKKDAFLVNKAKRGGVYVDMLIKFISGTHGEQRESTLVDLESRVSAMRTMNLTLAYDPPTSHITEFSGVVKSNLGSDVVIKLRVDASIIGGAMIEIDGRFVDSSLKKSLSEATLVGLRK